MWIKLFRHRKLQTAMIFLIIMVCTTLLAGAMSILISLEKPSREFAEECKAATAKLYTHMGDEKEMDLLRRQFQELDCVDKVEVAQSHSIEENMFFNDSKVDVFADLTEYSQSIFGADYYLEGGPDTAASLAEDECMIAACISNKYDLHIGDTITLKLSDRDLSYRVAAVYSDPYQTSTAFDSDILVRKLPQVKYAFNLYIYGKEKVTGEQISEAYYEAYDGRLNGFLLTLEDRIDNGMVVGRIIGAILLAVGSIMLLVSGLMIRFLIKNIILTDEKSIAIYKTIGYTSGDVIGMYLKFYFIVVTLASLFGIIASVYISDTILTSIFENMGKLKTQRSMWSGIVCYLITVGYIVSILLIVFYKLKRIKPVTALSGMDYGSLKKRKRYNGNSGFQFSAFGIAYRTLLREKRNAIGMIITCIITVFSMNFIVITLDIADTMKEHNDFWLGVDKADVMISIVDSGEFDTVRSLTEQDSRTKYCLCNYLQYQITMKWKKGSSITNMDAFVYDDFAASKLPVTKGKNPVNSSEIAISTTIAGELHKDIGDYIEVYLREDIKANLLITGIFQSYYQFGEVCRLTTSAFTERAIDLAYNNISVYLRDGKETEDFIKDMKKQLEGKANVIKRTEQYSGIMDMIVAPQKKAIPPVAFLIGMIGALNIFCIVYLKNMRSQHSNSVYISIGYTAWHLILANVYYVLMIALISIAVALPASIIGYSSIMKFCLSMFHFTEYPMVIRPKGLFIANAAIIAGFLFSTLLSSKALLKVNARILVRD